MVLKNQGIQALKAKSMMQNFLCTVKTLRCLIEVAWNADPLRSTETPDACKITPVYIPGVRGEVTFLSLEPCDVLRLFGVRLA